MTRRRWTPAENDMLREHYPHRRTEDVAAMLGRPVKSVLAQAA